MHTNKKENSAQKRGFTLTELALVMGVMGIILGSIWVAASIAWNKSRDVTASRQLLQAVQNIREYYMNAQGLPGGCNADITQTLLTNGIFPPEMKGRCTTCASGYQVDDPYVAIANGGSFRVYTACPNGSPTSFRIIFYNPPYSSCIRLMTSAVNYRDQSMGVTGLCLAGIGGNTCGTDPGYTGYGWDNSPPNVSLFVGGFYYRVACVNGICGVVQPHVPPPYTTANITTPTLQDVENGCTLQPGTEIGWEFNLHH